MFYDKKYRYMIIILECQLDNYIIGIIGSNYINLCDVMCSYAVNGF
jgi:hypothetical protein